jgi:hypothetical protein
VTAESLETGHLRERRFQAFDRVDRSNPAKVASRDRRGDTAEIGRGGAMGNRWPGILRGCPAET